MFFETGHFWGPLALFISNGLIYRFLKKPAYKMKKSNTDQWPELGRVKPYGIKANDSALYKKKNNIWKKWQYNTIQRAGVAH